MNHDDVLKLWQTIQSLPAIKAKLALFGAVIQKLGWEGEPLEGVSQETILEARNILMKILLK